MEEPLKELILESRMTVQRGYQIYSNGFDGSMDFAEWTCSLNRLRDAIQKVEADIDKKDKQ